MTKTFDEGIDELRAMVGGGTMTGTISVNQIYAHYQDSGFGPHGTPAALFKHPRGGEAAYLSGQMPERRDEVISAWARNIFDGALAATTIRLLQSFAEQVFLRAPREFEILRNSTSLKLENHGRVEFLEPALMPRLSDPELKAIRRASGGALTPALKKLGKLG